MRISNQNDIVVLTIDNANFESKTNTIFDIFEQCCNRFLPTFCETIPQLRLRPIALLLSV